MKATIEIPDELYRQVKAKSALEGRAIRDVTIELYRAWVAQERTGEEALLPEQWLAEWVKFGEESLRDAPPGPSAREILEEDRNRLQRRS
jgi:hypothetical protein